MTVEVPVGGTVPGAAAPALAETAPAGLSAAARPTSTAPTSTAPTSAIPVVPAAPMSQNAERWLDATCPYLRSTDGTWRSVVAQRGQRCWGQTPPAPLEPATQERLCSTDGHLGCEIFVAAEARRHDALTQDHVDPERLEGRFGVLVRPAPLVLDGQNRPRTALPAGASLIGRSRAAIGLLLAGGVVVVALFAGLGNGAVPVPTQPPIAFVSPTPNGATAAPASAAPTVTPASPSPTQAPSMPDVTPFPTRTPRPSPSPGAIRTTYKVHKGDTLAKIGAKFGVTGKQIRAVNDLGDPPQLRYGQTINIPYP